MNPRLIASAMLLSVTFFSLAAQDGAKRSIVVFHAGVDAAAATSDIVKAHGVKADHIYSHAFRGFAGHIGNAKRLLASDPRVKYIEADVAISLPKHNIEGKPSGGSTAPTQKIPTGIARIGTLLSATAAIDNNDVRVNADVAIIDTGIAKHADLLIYRSVSMIGGRDGSDGHGHGSHVAGIVAALDNSSGVVGVAPGARLWAVKVLDNKGSGYLSNAIAGVDYVAANSAYIEVANMSIGWPSNQPLAQSFLDAVNGAVAKGVVIVAAAGNESADASTLIPAAFPAVLTISAIADSDGKAGALGAVTSYGADDSFATFSNFGTLIDLAAPGVSILSTYKSGLYATMSGTSMASPHVAGVAALYLANNPKPVNDVGVLVVRDMLLNTATGSWWTPNAASGDPDGSPEALVNASAF